MRFLIQQPNTGMYLAGGLRWTANPAEALAFVNEVRARDYSIYNRLGGTAVSVPTDNRRSEAQRLTGSLAPLPLSADR